jgi:hypothetical protein
MNSMVFDGSKPFSSLVSLFLDVRIPFQKKKIDVRIWYMVDLSLSVKNCSRRISTAQVSGCNLRSFTRSGVLAASQNTLA